MTPKQTESEQCHHPLITQLTKSTCNEFMVFKTYGPSTVLASLNQLEQFLLNASLISILGRGFSLFCPKHVMPFSSKRITLRFIWYKIDLLLGLISFSRQKILITWFLYSSVFELLILLNFRSSPDVYPLIQFGTCVVFQIAWTGSRSCIILQQTCNTKKGKCK